MLRKIQISFKIVLQNTAKNCFRKLQLGQKNVAQITEIKNKYSTNYSFLKQKIAHFTVSTKYRNRLILLRKIQYEMLRKIQIFPINAAQNTGDFVAQNTDLYQNCFAKYRKELLRLLCAFYRCCAKYNKPTKLSEI